MARTGSCRLGFSIVDNRAGVTFGVELYVPWDAPEIAVDLVSVGTVPLRIVPDVFGMIGCRDSATESHILQGRGAHSIRVLVPDCRSLDQNFHDVTVVDMGDLPQSHVSIPELSELAHKWSPAVINHMRWRQPEMRRAARVQYRNKQLAPCVFCGTLIGAACGTLPLGFGSVVAVPSVVVHRLEGHATGLGPCSRGPQGTGGGPIHQNGEAFLAVDGYTPGVYRIADVTTLRV